MVWRLPPPSGRLVDMSESQYITSKCAGCIDGTTFDITNADKVYVSHLSDKCSACNGTGIVRKVRAVVEAAARADARWLAVRVENSNEAVGDMPDWMC